MTASAIASGIAASPFNHIRILRDKSFARMTDGDWDLVHAVHVYGNATRYCAYIIAILILHTSPSGSYKVAKAAWPHFNKQKFGR